MTLDIQRYVSKPETVDAVRATKDNLRDLAAWCGGEYVEFGYGPGREPSRHVEVPEHPDCRGTGGLAFPGNWVIRHESGVYTVQPHYDDGWSAGFHETWQPATSAQVSEYRLSLLPEDHVDRQAFELAVSWRGRGLWAVTRFGSCLSADGKWDHEPSPSNRDDEWLTAHRFDEATALRLANEALPTVTVMGKTARDVLAEREASQ